MTKTTLILRSLRFHARAHLGVVLGAAVGSAALIGALLVGDSVRASLREMALTRLGSVHAALAANDRLFREQLATDLENALAASAAGVLQLPGTAARTDGAARANNLQVLGVNGRFWELAQQPPNLPTNWPQGVVISASLAQQLKTRPGEELLLRVQKPSRLSREAPISPQQDLNVALRLPVSAVVSDAEFGRFSLQANQVPPYNAFVSLSLLQRQVEAPGRANLLLAGRGGARVSGLQGDRTSGGQDARASGDIIPAAIAQAVLRRVWQLADAGLELRRLTNVPGFELRSERVFLEPPVIRAAEQASPNVSKVLTYFVNELRVGDRSTPYSMVAGLEKPLVPDAMRDDEILINPWLQEDLQAKPGDELTLTYYVPGSGRNLQTKSERFRVREVVPFQDVYADPELMPDFPGVAKAETSHDWDAGFPIDMGRIREKDEAYWKSYRGTPKAFVTLAGAQRMWTNRFGNLTAIRFPPNGPPLETLRESIRQRLDPAELGLNFQRVRAQALAAAENAQDFGELFLGFSFFLIVAALVLMALLFQFGLEQRLPEIGTLLALGFTPKAVRGLMWREGIALAFIGGVLGMLGAIGYARAMLYGLATIWRQAVGTSALHYHASATSLAIGLVASVVVAAVTIGIVLRKQARQPIRQLLNEGAESAGAAGDSQKKSRAAILGVAAGVVGLGLTGWMLSQRGNARPELFFAAGSLFLVAGLGLCSGLLSALGRSGAARRVSLAVLGFRNATRRRRRSVATITLLACGSFIVVAVGANKLDAARDAHQRSSGTGGFALIGQSTIPVVHDLNTQAGREFFSLDSNDLAGVEFVPFRVREGDDASCLNLNRAQTPRLLGVNPALLQQRGAFTFAGVAKGLPREDPWSLLQRQLPDGAIPAIGDQASIKWALHKNLGDTLTYIDSRGQPFDIRLVAGLANSILQGSLIIPETEFARRFPDEAGYKMFLIDVPTNRVAEVSALLSRALQDVGLELTPAAQRLAAFNAVQNTYLNTFQILGGLGLLLGSAGLGIVVLRNVLERRSELALLQAVGFRRGLLRRLILSEHGGLLLLGLAVGMIAALVAVLPVLLAPGAKVHYLSLGVTLGAVLISGLLWTCLAAWLALRGQLLVALRNE